MARVMKRIFLVVGWAAGALILMLTGLALSSRDRLLQFANTWQERSEGAELANKLVTSQDMLDYVAAHPEQVSIASWDVGQEDEGLFFHAERLQPAAGALEMNVLAQYARAVAQGVQSEDELIPVATWERYWLSQTDGGAHISALQEARARGVLEQDRGAIRMRDLVRALVRYGDHAAADLLLDRYARAQNVDPDVSLTTALTPFSGMWLSWIDHVSHAPNAPAAELLARYNALGSSDYARLTWQLADRLRDDATYRTLVRERLEQHGVGLSLKEQAQLSAAFSPRGDAHSYAQLLQQIVRSELPGSAAMRAQLEFTPTQSEFAELAVKRGSLPGVLTSVSYGRGKGEDHTRVLAVFLRQLPLAVWLHLAQAQVLQRFENDLLLDAAFFAHAKRRLSQNEALRSAGLGTEVEARHALTQHAH
ncbi:MAG: hypothetical protein RL701_2689 [Pseudomonadota bacterium]|jgi:hypothetical protein